MNIRVLVPPQSRLEKNKRPHCRSPYVHLEEGKTEAWSQELLYLALVHRPPHAAPLSSLDGESQDQRQALCR